MRTSIRILLAATCSIVSSYAASIIDKPIGFASIPIAEGPYKAEFGTIGGGESQPVIATDARSLALLLADDLPRTVMVANDIDLSFPVDAIDVPPNVDLLNQPDIDGLPNGTRPLTHPFFFKDGQLVRVPCSIRVGSNKTIFSVDGRSLKHGGFVVRSKGNVIIRNLRFADLWEWDEMTYPLWDRNTWDFIRIEEGAHHVWVDHCTFNHSYDGYLDVVRRSDFITVSYCKYDGSPMLQWLNSRYAFAQRFDESWIGQQYNALLAAKAPKFLADPTIAKLDPNSVEAKMAFVAKYGRHWKNTLIGNSNVRTFDRAHLNVTLHHNWWHQSVSRAPRARFGNIHLFNNLVENIDNGVMTGFEASILVQNCYFIGGKKLLYGDEGVGRALGTVYHGPSAKNKNDGPSMEDEYGNVTGEISGRTEPQPLNFPESRYGHWHPVGDWWKIGAGEMETTLPYKFEITDTARVPREVVKNSGAGKITIAADVRKYKVEEQWVLSCSACHGMKGDAKTVVGLRWEMRDYTNPDHQKAFDDGYAEKIIREGMPRDALYRMAPFQGRLEPAEIKDLVQYLRKLDQKS